MQSYSTAAQRLPFGHVSAKVPGSQRWKAHKRGHVAAAAHALAEIQRRVKTSHPIAATINYASLSPGAATRNDLAQAASYAAVSALIRVANSESATASPPHHVLEFDAQTSKFGAELVSNSIGNDGPSSHFSVSVSGSVIHLPKLLPVTSLGGTFLGQPQAVGQSKMAVGRAGTALVSGGLGGLGQLIAHWLAETEAGNIVLLGRSGRADSSSGNANSKHSSGTGTVTQLRCDVASRDEVSCSAADGRLAHWQDVKLVFHAGGVLRDSMLPRQQLSDIQAVFAPKVSQCS